jgi:hypothetical protein
LPAAYGCGGKTATVPKLANPASAKVTMATVYSENSPTRRPKVVYATNPLSMAFCPMKCRRPTPAGGSPNRGGDALGPTRA